ncbi:hypothetical protein [Phormidium nigroviride]
MVEFGVHLSDRRFTINSFTAIELCGSYVDFGANFFYPMIVAIAFFQQP